MKRCPITYEIIRRQENYSQRGLRLLSPQLKDLHPLQLNAEEQRKEAVARVGKMSIQGIQTKLSAQLKIKQECFEIVDQQGHYILKPQSEIYPELPENEAISMSLAKIIGLEVPVHGLVYSKDNSLTYFIKRFDRTGHHKKLALEDFTQLSGEDRYTKYNSSMEKIVKVISQYCTFPKIEFVKLFKLTLFNFLIGNEDMHLKNFSLITRDQKITLSPVYDLLNSTIALGNTAEEIALSLNGKKSNLKKQDFLQYFAVERLGLNQIIISEVIQQIQQALPQWHNLINISFLSKVMKKKYLALLLERSDRLGL
ncbi:MAG: HipA domain-containing protein [Gammaproteobacteria bacterium]|nr:HipA domain-containing protein [Gammaproteobacteria bacterium]